MSGQFPSAWQAGLDGSKADRRDERLAMERLALWMIGHGYATGHGDTFDDMLDELVSQVAKRSETDGWNKGVSDMAQSCPVCREAALPKSL